jgi:hypothetical protein
LPGHRSPARSGTLLLRCAHGSKRLQTIIEASRRDAIEANPHALFQAAGHPEVVAKAISILTQAR